MSESILTNVEDFLLNFDQDKHKNLSKVINFLSKRTNTDNIDYKSSLIVLKGDKEIKAHLNVDETICELPQIKRTGISAPWMPGRQLKLQGNNYITSPTLQRYGCILISNLAQKFKILSFLRSNEKIIDHLHANLQSSPTGESLASEEIENQFYLWLKKNIKAEEDEIENLINNLKKEAGFIKYLTKRIKEMDDKAKGKLTAIDLNFSKLLDELLKDEWIDKRHLNIKNIKDENTKVIISYNNEKPGSCTSSIKNLVLQGCGDLSMNKWNVAFFRNPEENGKEYIVMPEAEPYNSRKYNCLISWKNYTNDKRETTEKNIALDFIEHNDLGINLKNTLSISQLKFYPSKPYISFPQIKQESEISFDLHKHINFSVYGKLILKNGEIIPKTEVIDEFQDIRHIFKLPNLNIDLESLYKTTIKKDGKICWKDDGEKERKEKINQIISLKSKPRNFFGQFQDNDVWLLEYALLNDCNLRRLACITSISVRLDMLGAPKIWIEYCLYKTGYQKENDQNRILKQGFYSWNEESPDTPLLNIYLLPNIYPCTIIGIGKVFEKKEKEQEKEQANALFLLAWGHDRNYGGHSIWDCAEVLQAAGAKYALVMDEGDDVFQYLLKNENDEELNRFIKQEIENGDLHEWEKVPISYKYVKGLRIFKRKSLRASLAFWQETEEKL